MGQLTLILGGARSGKSAYAERLAKQRSQSVTYIATAQSLDAEMSSRIAEHRSKRPPDWQTLEIPYGVAGVLEAKPLTADVILLDCLTLLVSNLLTGTSFDVDKPDEQAACTLVEAEISQLKAAIETSPADWIVVSNEVGMGLVPPYPLGRIYRDLLGWANQQLAFLAEEVYLMVAGIPWLLTPPPPANYVSPEV